jgi:hypothetical protein
MWSEAEKTWSGAFPNTPIIGKIIATAKTTPPSPILWGYLELLHKLHRGAA